MGLASLVPSAHQARVLEYSQMFRYRRLRDAGESVNACTVCSPSLLSRSKIARRVGSARALKTMLRRFPCANHNCAVMGCQPPRNQLRPRLKCFDITA